ncbi:sulfite exporter TauE/SafE family protein [Stella sp.]|uniref:sulfite exporter TauE/SafE family protein n=1 Tax=Stella sp. TaxID=2912054 RepID=UPI0035B256B2
MSIDPGLLAGALAAFVLAGFVKGVLGFGLPTVLVAGLALVLPPAQAVALMLLPAFVTNVAQAGIGRQFGPLTWRLRGFLGGLVAGTLLAGPVLAAWLGSGGAGATRIALGCALLAYAASALAGRVPNLTPRTAALLAVPSGLASGTIGFASGIFVFPTAPYLQALGLERGQLSQAMGIAFTLATVVLAAALAGHGGIAVPDLGWSAAGTVPALAGMWLGMRLRDRLGRATFRNLFLLALGAIGLHFALA